MNKQQIVERYRKMTRPQKRQVSGAVFDFFEDLGIEVSRQALFNWRNNPEQEGQLHNLYVKAYTQAIQQYQQSLTNEYATNN